MGAFGAEGPLIAVVGMVREARIIEDRAARVIVSGGDAATAERRLEAAVSDLDQAFLLSFGVCGALSQSLKAGDLVIGRDVVAVEGVYLTDQAWTRRLSDALPLAMLATIAAGDRMIGSVTEKRALGEASGAVAVDMESHITARVAQRHGMPCAVVRAVSDAADHALPSAALAGLRADGRPDIAAVLRALIRHPDQLPALIRTALQAERGFKALSAATASEAWANPCR